MRWMRSAIGRWYNPLPGDWRLLSIIVLVSCPVRRPVHGGMLKHGAGGARRCTYSIRKSEIIKDALQWRVNLLQQAVKDSLCFPSEKFPQN